MKHLTILLISLGMMTGIAVGADEIPEKLLIATGNYNGPSARALGLGGTYTGIADDYSSIWWNPAGLAQVKRIEMQGSISRTGFSNDASFSGTARDGSTNSMRLNNLGMVFPVPVYQGALSFAFGYNQVADFDRRTRADLVDGSGTSYGFDELESGRLGFWSLASAFDVSPNLAIGAGINYWTGVDEFSSIEREPNLAGDKVYERTIDTKLNGWNFSFGGLFRAGRFARIGAMAQTAMSTSIKENFVYTDFGPSVTEDERGYNNYRMNYPALFRVGGSIAPGRWLIAADIEYRDWNSLKFISDTPYQYYDSVADTTLPISKASANQQIKDLYNSTTRISFGGEYLFPMYGVRLRTGYSFEPSNFVKFGSEADRGALSFGFGVLIDRSVMVDLTYRTASFEENFTEGLSEDIRSSAAVMTISYRM